MIKMSMIVSSYRALNPRVTYILFTQNSADSSWQLGQWQWPSQTLCDGMHNPFEQRNRSPVQLKNLMHIYVCHERRNEENEWIARLWGQYILQLEILWQE